jgi:hypothetical protein
MQPESSPIDLGLVSRTSLPEAKIALFRSLFRGRDDVYARRFESRKTGKSGYAPACANEWVRGICEKSWPQRGDRNHDGLAAALIFCSLSQRDKGVRHHRAWRVHDNLDRRPASLEKEMLVRSTDILP